MNILSIASFVAYGHVGNSAAVFPLQVLGAEVWPIATVRFSIHPGYGGFTGAVTEPAKSARWWMGSPRAGCSGARCGAVLLPGDDEDRDAVLHGWGWCAGQSGGALLLLPDGDDGPGSMRARAWLSSDGEGMAEADIVTPNRFELGWLTGREMGTMAAAKDAAAALAARLRPGGPGWWW